MDPVPESILDLIDSENYWLFHDNEICHDGMQQKLNISTSKLVEGNSISCCITGGGDLEIHMKRKRAVGWRKVPVDKQIWGVVAICGRAVKIQSEFYSGELYSYKVYSVSHSCMYMHLHIHM